MSRRSRGRPRTNRPKRDTGTPELAQKRARGLTAETLDLCLERGIISPQQHWCGVHLRWLYTLRFGAPGVRASDARHASGIDIRTEDPEWRESREAEYAAAVKRLGETLSSLMLSLCVFNERPFWLERAPLTAARARRVSDALASTLEGFEMLENLWCRKRNVKY